jgi:hypothetical protein
VVVIATAELAVNRSKYMFDNEMLFLDVAVKQTAVFDH